MLITQAQFEQYKQQGFSRIPVARQVLADFDTPLSVYLKLADQPYSYLLESVQGGDKWGRYSIIGLPSSKRIQISGNEVSEIDADSVTKSVVDDPLKWVDGYISEFKSPDIAELPRLNGGLVGYFAYDTVRYVEPKLANSQPDDPLNLPDILLMVSDELVVFDNLAGQLYFIVQMDAKDNPTWEAGQARLDELLVSLAKPLSAEAFDTSDLGDIQETDFKSHTSQEDFEAGVNKIKQYIVDGDVMQVVPSQRMSVDFPASPLNLYRALRCTNPSPYMYYFNLDDFYIVGSSPEILAHFENGQVTVRPIAGTRKRGANEAEDLALEKDLLADPKEIAEHLMLIDLGRNDVGRISDIGSVKLTDKMVIERYSHVMHIVSNVVGAVQKEMSAIDVLKATLPAGTLSGAPKVRAMEIIDELETVKRGIYGGAVGYIAYDGNMDTAIAIRTAIIKDKRLYIQAGAGIVADSNPTSEWEETLSKGRAVFRAAQFAMQGLKMPGASK